MPTTLLSFALTLACALTPLPAPVQDSAGPVSAEQLQLEASLLEQGVRLDSLRQVVSIPARVAVPDELLEYLLVGPAGASHESIFVTPVQAGVLNVALLSLGVEPGANASWSPKDPPPTESEVRAGVSPYDVHLPTGDGFYLYAAWRAGDELYFFRVEDLIRNLLRGHSMERHPWVYLGSRMVPDGAGGEDFAADIYQNLICISYFSEGYTLATGALADCVEQTIWMANAWLLPEPGKDVRILVSRTPLAGLPAGYFETLPDIAEAPAAEDEAGR